MSRLLRQVRERLINKWLENKLASHGATVQSFVPSGVWLGGLQTSSCRDLSPSGSFISMLQLYLFHIKRSYRVTLECRVGMTDATIFLMDCSKAWLHKMSALICSELSLHLKVHYNVLAASTLANSHAFSPHCSLHLFLYLPVFCCYYKVWLAYKLDHCQPWYIAATVSNRSNW